ncbi:hypothetical protein DL770_000787 [Monosporascus sp. CRB-9-2]|nr:hypothetical protein DL770_000787 [Monosporascus sp. CRB-9-2]
MLKATIRVASSFLKALAAVTGRSQASNPAYLPIVPPQGAKVSPPGVPLDGEPCVAVIGVGYVGTHLVETFSSSYRVLGFDISEARIDKLRAQFSNRTGVKLTTCKRDLDEASHFLISVPTPLREDKTVDLSCLKTALETVSAHARLGATVVIESSLAVGTTRRLLGPICASHGLFGGMSPERVDPGRTSPPVRSIPKVVSGLGGASLAAIVRLYSSVFDTLVQVSCPEVAEMMKLYENCQRMMGVAFANEMADACIQHGIDPFEVSRAAATKPFGYMPFTPSVGVGGPCIPANSYYLLSNCEFPLLEAAAKKMEARPAEIARRVTETLICNGTTQERPRVLVVGVGYKAGQAVLSNSPGLDLATALAESGKVDVMFADSLVKQEAIPRICRLADEDWTRSALKSFNMIIVTAKQVGMDFGVLRGLGDVRVETWCQ